MKNKFIKKYEQIIYEAKFKHKKWNTINLINGIEVLENIKHLSDRLSLRYNVNYTKWAEWQLIKKYIINSFIGLNAWANCSGKSPYQKGFTIYLTLSNMWLSGILQNDLEDNCKRIYFSTFLPEEPTFNKHDIKLDIPL